MELKRKIKQQKNQLKINTDELNDYKTTTNFQQIEELKIENKLHQEESLRLRTMIDSLSSLIDVRDLTLMQSQIIQIQQQKNYLEGIIRIKDEDLFKLTNQTESLSNYLTKLNGDLKQSNQKLADEKAENSILNRKILEDSEKLKHLDSAIKLEKQLKKVDRFNKVEELQRELINRNQNIEYLEKQVNELKSRFEEVTQAEKKQFQERMNRMQESYVELNDRYKNMLMNSFSQVARPDKIEKERHDQEEETEHDTSYQPQEKYVAKQLRVIKFEEVKPIGQELSLRFRIHKIAENDLIDQFLFDEFEKTNGKISIKSLNIKFSKYPFLLTDQNKAILLARYLVEDNSKEFIEVDVESCQQLIIVKSVFWKLVGNYKILNMAEERRLKNIIIPVILKYKNSLKSHFGNIPRKGELISKKDILETFIYMDIEFKQEELDYLFLKLFESSNSIDYFSYQKLFDIFKLEERNLQMQKTQIIRTAKQKTRMNIHDTFQYFGINSPGIDTSLFQ